MISSTNAEEKLHKSQDNLPSFRHGGQNFKYSNDAYKSFTKYQTAYMDKMSAHFNSKLSLLEVTSHESERGIEGGFGSKVKQLQSSKDDINITYGY